MKDSGVEWIGKIPESWIQLSLIKTLREPITDGPHETPNYVDNGIPFISVDSLSKGENVNLSVAKKFISEEDYEIFNKKTKLTDGDILFTKSATIGKTAIVNMTEKYMIWSPLAVIKYDSSIIDNKFLYYILNSDKYIEHVSLLGTSNTQVNVGMKTLQKSRIPIPKSLREQVKCSEYLDEKVTLIDTIIKKTEESIEEYKKYKQSLITETVTKGLDPNVKMKDSGIEWNKNIPEHWEVVNPKRLFSLRKEKAFDGDEQLTASQKHGILFQKDFMEIENQKVVVVEKDFSILKHVEPNDFVISMRSFQGGLEYSSLRGCISSAYVMVIPNYDVYPPYFRWLLKSAKYINALQSTSNLVRDGQAMRFSNFVQIPLFRLPIDEQRNIADYLDAKMNAIDNLINQKEKLLSEIESYKKSLIYEVVTGKKEIN